MPYKLAQFFEKMYYHFWLVPTLIILFSVILAAGLISAENFLDLNNLELYLGSFLDMDAIKIIFSTIASSIITITCVTFSITVLTLSIASNHLGARLVPNFMKQKITQIFLGVLISTFIYAIFILQSISVIDVHKSIAYLAVSIGMLYTIISIIIFIFFINFVCHMIQIDNILEFLMQDLIFCIKRFLVVNDIANKKDSINKIINYKNSETKFYDLQKYNSYKVKSLIYGYIQYINYNTLFKIADKYSVIISINYKVGFFVLKNLPLVTIYSKTELSEKTVQEISSKALKCVSLGVRRTSLQDIEFLFEELAEIALIALSPSINNPYTAKHCIDRFTQGLEAISHHKMAHSLLCDKNGQIKVIRKVATYNDIIKSSFTRLRQQAKLDLSITLYLLQRIRDLLDTEITEEIKTILINQAQIIYEEAKTQNLNIKDIKDLEDTYKDIALSQAI
tara:strand:+ start:6655 stop:8007 length:1353 start_codon:yes stop_codon:yes gene_type:complete